MIQKILFIGMLTVGLAPALMFAGRPLWVLAPAAILAGVLLAVLGVSRIVSADGPRLRTSPWNDRFILAASLLWGVVVAYAVWQTLPAGPASGAGSPWADAARLLGVDFEARNSLNAGASLVGALRLALYGAALLLAYWLCRDRQRAWMAVQAVVAVATLAAIYGLLMKAFGIEYVLGQEKRYYVGWATGPFENRSSFASYLAIGLAANAALWARAYRREVGGGAEGRERLRLVLEFVGRKGGLLALPGLAMLGAGLASGSRAGLAAIAVALATTAGLIVLRWARGRQAVVGAAAIVVLLAAAALAALAGQEASGARQDLETSFDQRAEILADTRRMIREGPTGGVGLGAFADALHRYKSSELVNDWRRARNVYLEAVAELGAPVAALKFVAVALIAVAAARGILRRRRVAPVPAAAIGAFAATAAHSFFDFPLQEPGVCLTLAVLWGAGAALADAPRDQ